MVSINFNSNLNSNYLISNNTKELNSSKNKDFEPINNNLQVDGFINSKDNNAKKQACWGFKETKEGLFSALVEEKNGRFIITVTRANGEDVLVTEINKKFKSEKDAQNYLNKNGYVTEAW